MIHKFETKSKTEQRQIRNTSCSSTHVHASLSAQSDLCPSLAVCIHAVYIFRSWGLRFQVNDIAEQNVHGLLQFAVPATDYDQGKMEGQTRRPEVYIANLCCSKINNFSKVKQTKQQQHQQKTKQKNQTKTKQKKTEQLLLQ